MFSSLSCPAYTGRVGRDSLPGSCRNPDWRHLHYGPDMPDCQYISDLFAWVQQKSRTRTRGRTPPKVVVFDATGSVLSHATSCVFSTYVLRALSRSGKPPATDRMRHHRRTARNRAAPRLHAGTAGDVGCHISRGRRLSPVRSSDTAEGTKEKTQGRHSLGFEVMSNTNHGWRSAFTRTRSCRCRARRAHPCRRVWALTCEADRGPGLRAPARRRPIGRA